MLVMTDMVVGTVDLARGELLGRELRRRSFAPRQMRVLGGIVFLLGVPLPWGSAPLGRSRPSAVTERVELRPEMVGLPVGSFLMGSPVLRHRAQRGDAGAVPVGPGEGSSDVQGG